MVRKNHLMKEAIVKFFYYRTEKKKRKIRNTVIMFVSIFLALFTVLQGDWVRAITISIILTLTWIFVNTNLYKTAGGMIDDEGLKVSVPKNLLEGTCASEAYFFVRKKGAGFFPTEEAVHFAFIEDGKSDSITEFEKDFYNLKGFSPVGLIAWKEPPTA